MSEGATAREPGIEAGAPEPARHGSSPARMKELTALSITARRSHRAALKELADLPELVDVASAKAILSRLLDLGVSGRVPGVTLGACVRSVEVFLRACDSEANKTELVEALGLLRELKARRSTG